METVILVLSLSVAGIEASERRSRNEDPIFHAWPEDPGSFCDCVKSASVFPRQPGSTARPQCRVHAGIHYVGAERCTVSGLHGTEDSPVLITGAGDGPVVIDGTVAIPNRFTSRDGLWAADAGGAAPLQLFIDGELQVLARTPNARWSDKSIFYAVADWFRSTSPGEHNVSSGEGLLRDQGPCASLASCCARCNTHGLVKSGVNATGALAILNLWSCDTGVQSIERHSAADPAELHYRASWVGLCDTYRGGDGRYYLEGTLPQLDSEEEWLFDKDRDEVLVAVRPPPSAEIRARVSDYVLVLDDASWVVFANLSFRATTLSVAGNVGNISMQNLVFNYSAVSRRAVGDHSPPVALTLWRAREAGNSPTPAGLVIDDVTVRYSDGPALLLSGVQSRITESLFEWNDWSTVGGTWPVGVQRKGKAHRATTVWVDDCEGLTVERCTFRNNGAAQSINAGGKENGGAPRVELNLFESQLAIQDDGSFVEGGGMPSTVYIRNWATNSGKAGLRWDGYYPTTVGGVMMENVVWNASAVVVKGDRHNVTQNTVFDGSDITASHAAHDRPRYQDHTSPLDNLTVLSAAVGEGTKHFDPRADQLTVFTRNIFDAVGVDGATCPEAPNCTLPGRYIDNLIGTDVPGAPGTPFDIRAELRAPFHRDFRPCPSSHTASLGAGAYPRWSSRDATYWIPGRREPSIASVPLPPEGAVGVYTNTDLMFLPARNALSHTVYIAKAGDALKYLGNSSGAEANVFQLERPLESWRSYEWRVDTITPTGTVRGAPWRFMTGAELACQISPRPPPRPPRPGPTTCASALSSVCPGMAHKGPQVGDPCYDCVVDHNSALVAAGCWGAHARHAFIEKFCGDKN